MKLLKRLFCILVLVALLSISSSVLPQRVSAFTGAGAGTSGSPYLITSCAQLQEMDNAKSAYYQQAQNIDCTGYLFASVATSGNFTGTLDGHGYIISNLTISGTSGSYGLFANTGSGATITNVHLVGGSVSVGSSSYSASFVGIALGNLTISDCSSSVNNTGESASGIVSLVTGGTTTITRTSFTGNLNTTWTYGGGLVGVASGGTANISDSYTSGTYTGQTYEGGLVGYSIGTISNSYSTANITANGGSMVGGLVGYVSSGSVSNSFFAGTVGGSSSNMGTVFGAGNGTVTNVYFDSTVTGSTTCGGGFTCTAVNISNSAPTYFKNNKTNAPLNVWNFAGVWKRTTEYPIFGNDFDNDIPSTQFSAPAPASPPGCGDSAPSAAPYLFQVNSNGKSATLSFTPNAQNVSGYVIAFGYESGDMRFGTSYSQGASGGVQQYTISDLDPNETYYFKVRAQNGCMPGDWSNELHLSGGKNTSSKRVSYAQN